MPVTEFLWDTVTDSLVEEYDGGGALAAAYTGEPALYGPLLSTYRPGDGDSYPHYDALGSVRRLSDSLEVVSSPIDYSAWGELLTAPPAGFPFLYVGELGYYTDEEVEFIYVRARTYAAELARWLSCDPLSSGARTSLYEYAINLPKSATDPSGLKPAESTLAENVHRCYEGCVRDCHKQFLEGGFFEYSGLKYYVCKHECSRVCNRLYGSRLSSPTIIVTIAETTGLACPLDKSLPSCNALVLAPATEAATGSSAIRTATRCRMGTGAAIVVTIVTDILVHPDELPPLPDKDRVPKPLPKDDGKKKCKLIGSGGCNYNKGLKPCIYDCEGEQQSHPIPCRRGTPEVQDPPCPGWDGSVVEF